MPRGTTPLRAVRVADPLWSAAQAVAEERGENVSEVVRRALERYISSWDCEACGLQGIEKAAFSECPRCGGEG